MGMEACDRGMMAVPRGVNGVVENEVAMLLVVSGRLEGMKLVSVVSHHVTRCCAIMRTGLVGNILRYNSTKQRRSRA
jgi:hypothetical protein